MSDYTALHKRPRFSSFQFNPATIFLIFSDFFSTYDLVLTLLDLFLILIIFIYKMCILFFFINNKAGPNEFKLILVNNRDEFYSRPTENARIWDTNPKIIAGRDVESGREGGTWLGASANGKIGCLLNILQPIGKFQTDVAGRGFLALQFLKNDVSATDYISDIIDSNIQYNLFNLVLLEMKNNQYEAIYYNNVDHSVCPLDANMTHGFGNCLLSKPFRKVEKGKEIFHKIINQYGTQENKNMLTESLFEMMKVNKGYFPDEQLSHQGDGHSEEHLRSLSSIWVTIPEAKYGTRTTAVVLVDGNNHLSFVERSMKNPSANCEDFSLSEFSVGLKSTL